MSIYTIKQEYNDILSNPAYVDFETWEITEAWEEALKQNQDNLESKCENIARFMKNLENENLAYKNEADRLWKLHKTNSNKIKWLKKLLEFALNWQDLKTELFKFSFRKSETSEILEKDKLPKQFITTEMVEKIAWLPEIKKYLKQEIEARIEESKNDWKEFDENDIKLEVYSENWLDIKFKSNLQIK